jgi:hypothetical protein
VQYTELRDGAGQATQATQRKRKDKRHAEAAAATLRSAPVELVVRPAAAAALRLLSEAPANMRLSASNDSEQSRLLLSDVALQLVDR